MSNERTRVSVKWMNAYQEADAECTELRRKLEIASEALEKYADKSNWVGGVEYDDVAFDEFWNLAEDGWLTATNALDAMKGGG